MDSSLHMHVASLKIQDEIGAASSARLAEHAQRASRADAKTTGAPHGHRIAWQRMIFQSRRAAY